jgi:hypothetical protein
MRQAVAAAVRRLGVIPFFPADEDARLEIMRQLEAMIGYETLYGSTPQERLDWLVDAAVNGMRRWGGIPELRGLLCSRWRPGDRIEAYSSLPGYRPEDSESLVLAEHRNHKAIEAGRMSPKLLEATEGDRMPDDELAQLHNDTIGTLVEATKFPWQKTPKKSVAEAERELAEAPRRYLTEAEKARRLAEVEDGLKNWRRNGDEH